MEVFRLKGAKAVWVFTTRVALSGRQVDLAGC